MRWVEKSLMWQRAFTDLLFSSPILTEVLLILTPELPGQVLPRTLFSIIPLDQQLAGGLWHSSLICFRLGARPASSCSGTRAMHALSCV